MVLHAADASALVAPNVVPHVDHIVISHALIWVQSE